MRHDLHAAIPRSTPPLNVDVGIVGQGEFGERDHATRLPVFDDDRS
jgi:hypothetical protein